MPAIPNTIPSAATSGFNVLFQDNTGGTFTTIAEVQKITGPEIERTVIDVTNLTSPSDEEEVIVGMIKNGLVSLTLNFLPGNVTHRNIIAAIKSGTLYQFKIIWSDIAATTWTFSGYYLKFAPSAGGNNEKLIATVTIKPTGVLLLPS